jgi:hypothetical protein
MCTGKNLVLTVTSKDVKKIQLINFKKRINKQRMFTDILMNILFRFTKLGFAKFIKKVLHIF